MSSPINVPAGATAPCHIDPHGSYANAVVIGDSISATQVPICWATMDDDWEILPTPSIAENGVVMPVFDLSWGRLATFLEQACRKWSVEHSDGIKAGTLKGPYFTEGTEIKDPAVAGDVAYVSGYMEALKNVWDLPKIASGSTAIAFKSGFHDAIPLILRSAALEHRIMTAEQANCMLRAVQRGEQSPLLKRLTRLMSAPTNALTVVKAVEALMLRISKKFDRTILDAVLDRVSANRRAVAARLLPVAKKEVVREIQNGRKKTLEKTTVPVIVQPTIATGYRSLATDAEIATIVRWNSFARLDILPVNPRTNWEHTFSACQRVVALLTAGASQMRGALKKRKQDAYALLTEEERKNAKVHLETRIREIVARAQDSQVNKIEEIWSGLTDCETIDSLLTEINDLVGEQKFRPLKGAYATDSASKDEQSGDEDKQE